MNTMNTEEHDDDDVVVHITPYGLLTLSLDAVDAKNAVDALELYMRRNNVGIAIDNNNKLDFVKLQKIEQ